MIGKNAVATLAATATTVLALSATGDAVPKAEVRAVRSWENRVAEKYGRHFGEFRHAQGKENKCVRRGDEIECIISAHPCRER